MKPDKPVKRAKTWFLPLIAGLTVVAALAVVLFVPKNTGKTDNNTIISEKTESSVSAQAAESAADFGNEGNLVIHADRLSSEQVSFIRISGDSRIELLARAGDDGTARAALGTCQSCNGSPRAYYTQEGSQLKCNNCGLTFPISVLDTPGGGCHPIMLNEEILRYEGNDLVIDLEGLSAYERLFEKVAEHGNDAIKN